MMLDRPPPRRAEAKSRRQNRWRQRRRRGEMVVSVSVTALAESIGAQLDVALLDATACDALAARNFIG